MMNVSLNNLMYVMRNKTLYHAVYIMVFVKLNVQCHVRIQVIVSQFVINHAFVQDLNQMNMKNARDHLLQMMMIMTL